MSQTEYIDDLESENQWSQDDDFDDLSLPLLEDAKTRGKIIDAKQISRGSVYEMIETRLIITIQTAESEDTVIYEKSDIPEDGDYGNYEIVSIVNRSLFVPKSQTCKKLKLK